MTSHWIDQIWLMVVALGLNMARIVAILTLVPVFKGMQLKGMLRNSCALGIGLILLPYTLPSLQINGIAIAALILKETALGFLLAVLLSIPFWIFDWVGVMIDSQRGALNGSVFNPALGSDSLIGGLIKQSVILILIVTGGIPLLLEVLWQSYLIWPPTHWFPLPKADGIELWLSQISYLFTTMVLYAAPIVVCLMFVDFGMAVLGLFSPHLQVSVLAMPVKSLLGLFLLVVYLPQLWYQAESQLEGLHVLPNILRQLF